MKECYYYMVFGKDDIVGRYSNPISLKTAVSAVINNLCKMGYMDEITGLNELSKVILQDMKPNDSIAIQTPWIKMSVSRLMLRDEFQLWCSEYNIGETQKDERNIIKPLYDALEMEL